MILTTSTGGTRGSKSVSLGNDAVRGPTIVTCGSLVTKTFVYSYGSTLTNFIVPYGVTHICFAMVGGGGGGGGGAGTLGTSGLGGGGGGGGQVKVGRITAIGGARVDVVVGTGGSPGSNGALMRVCNGYYCPGCLGTYCPCSGSFVGGSYGGFVPVPAYEPTGGYDGRQGGASSILVTCTYTTPEGASPLKGYTGTYITAYGGGPGGASGFGYRETGFGGYSYHATTSTNYPYFKHCCGPAGRYNLRYSNSPNYNCSYCNYGGNGTIAGSGNTKVVANHNLSPSSNAYISDPITEITSYVVNPRVDLYCCGGYTAPSYGRCCKPGAGMSKSNPIRVVNAANVGTTWNTLCCWGVGGYGSAGFTAAKPGQGGSGGLSGCGANTRTPTKGANGQVIITYQVAQNRNVANELYCNGGDPAYAPPATGTVCMDRLRGMAYGYTRQSRTLQCPTYPGLTYVQCYCAPNFTNTSSVSISSLYGKCYWKSQPRPNSLPPTRTINATPGTYLHYATVCITTWGSGGRGGLSYLIGYNCTTKETTGGGGGGGGGISISRGVIFQTVNSTYKVYVGGGNWSFCGCSVICQGAGIGPTTASYNGVYGSTASSNRTADGGCAGYGTNSGSSSYGTRARGAAGHFGGAGGSGNYTVGASVSTIYCGGYGGLGTLTTIPNLCGGQFLQPYYLGGGGGGGGSAVGGYGTINSNAQPGNQGVCSAFYGGYGGYVVNGVGYSGTDGRQGTGQGGGGSPSVKYPYVTVTYPSSGGGGLFGAIFGGIIGFIVSDGTDLSGAIGGAIIGSLFGGGGSGNAQVSTSFNAVSNSPSYGRGGSGGVYVSYSTLACSGNTNANGKLFCGGCSQFVLNGQWHHLFLTSGDLKGIRPNRLT